MRINLNFHYDKLHLKEIIILIPKYHTNMVSFLTPILGLYGINVKEFINDFDIKTKFIRTLEGDFHQLLETTSFLEVLTYENQLVRLPIDRDHLLTIKNKEFIKFLA